MHSSILPEVRLSTGTDHLGMDEQFSPNTERQSVDNHLEEPSPTFRPHFRFSNFCQHDAIDNKNNCNAGPAFVVTRRDCQPHS